MTSTLYMWCGAATPTSLQPVFTLTDTAATVRAAMSVDADFTAPVYSDPATPVAMPLSTDSAAQSVRPGDVTGLDPDTRYYYCAEINGTLDLAHVGRARTLAETTTETVITFGSCWSQVTTAGITKDHPVGSAVAAQHDAGASLHMFLGDFGYDNINTASLAAYRNQYAAMHSIANLAIMARSTAWVHMWDDHDFGPDNSNKNAPGAAQAAQVYREVVPHYPFGSTDGQGAYHAFDLEPGIRVIVTDLRSYRSVDTDTDNASKTMLGATQKAWLKAEMLAAKNAGKLIIWANTQVWCIDGAYTTSGINADKDHWGAFSTERAELDNFRSVNGIRNMVILTGDSHAIGYRLDVDYSTAQDVPAPVFMSAAYSRAAAFRPAAWDEVSPSTEGDGHYGLLTIIKSGESWTVGCEFHHVDPSTAVDAIEFTASTSFDLPALAPVQQIGTGGPIITRDSDGNTLRALTLA